MRRTSLHWKKERRHRRKLIESIGWGQTMFTAVQDSGRPEGREVITISDTGIISFRNERTDKLITAFVARPAQIRKHWPEAPESIMNLATDHTRARCNAYQKVGVDNLHLDCKLKVDTCKGRQVAGLGRIAGLMLETLAGQKKGDKNMKNMENMVEKITIIAQVVAGENIQVDYLEGDKKEATMAIYNMPNKAEFIKTLERVTGFKASEYAPAIDMVHDSEFRLCYLVFINL